MNGKYVIVRGDRSGVFAGVFSLVSLVFFVLYDEKGVTKFIEARRKDGAGV